MTPTQFRVLKTAVELRSLSKAAAALGQTRPRVTEVIKVLENEFSGPVLIREPGNLHPTALGRAVLSHAHVILREYDALSRLSAKSPKLSSCALRVAAVPSLCCWPLPRILGAFQQRYPDVSVQLLESRPAEVPAWLAQSIADVAMSTFPVPGWDWLMLFEEPFVVVCQCNAYPSDDYISLGQLSNVPMIVLSDSTESAIQVAFQQAGSFLKSAYSATSYCTIFSMVQEGLGVSLLPKSIARLAPATLSSIPVKGAPSRAVGLIQSIIPDALVTQFAEEARLSLQANETSILS